MRIVYSPSRLIGPMPTRLDIRWYSICVAASYHERYGHHELRT